MTLFITSFIAGILTILAPCVLPLLPVTLGGAVAEAGNRRRPLVIIGALSLSVLVFTLLLKGTTALIGASPTFWNYISAVILFAFGLTLIFPITWARIVLKLPGHNKPDSWMARGYQSRSHWWGDILVGVALGPVFTTCSPTFFLILATVLPQSLSMGIIDLLAYIVGLAISLLLVAYVGQRLVGRLGWAIDPSGWFRKLLGALFILIAIAIAFGWDKQAESAILNSGFYDVTTLEQSIHQSLEGPRGLPGSAANPVPISGQSGEALTSTSTATSSSAHVAPALLAPGLTHDEGPYIEIAKPAGFVNSAPFKLADFVGKKVILVDFIDYSCINCERTFPYLSDWYTKYKDQGLEVVAIHTPEFAFEKDISNVTAAAKQFGLSFPIVLDNSYATWNAYQNEYWPHKYLIDIHGRVIYDHVGEGGDDVTEKVIVDALNERKQALGEPGTVALGTSTMPAYTVQAESQETYFGAMRNDRFGDGAPGVTGDSTYTTPVILDPDLFYLGGAWHIDQEYAQTASASSTLSYVFTSKDLYLVAASADGAPIGATVLIDGASIPAPWQGTDVRQGRVYIGASRLYRIYSGPALGQHRVDIIFDKPGVQVYTFTFG